MFGIKKRWDIPSKKGMVWDEMGFWIIALILLAILLIFIFFLGKGGNSMIDNLKEFLTFGR
jgi:hypothetical protein